MCRRKLTCFKLHHEQPCGGPPSQNRQYPGTASLGSITANGGALALLQTAIGASVLLATLLSTGRRPSMFGRRSPRPDRLVGTYVALTLPSCQEVDRVVDGFES